MIHLLFTNCAYAFFLFVTTNTSCRIIEHKGLENKTLNCYKQHCFVCILFLDNYFKHLKQNPTGLHFYLNERHDFCLVLKELSHRSTTFTFYVSILSHNSHPSIQHYKSICPELVAQN